MKKTESKYFHTAERFDKALLSLLEKKPFEYVTVSELCEAAEVNRSTFYLHYENTSDVLKEASAYVLDNFASYFSVDMESITSKYATCDLQELNFINEEYLHPYLSFIKDNQRLFFTVLSQPTVFDSRAIFQRLFDNIFNPILDRFHYPRDEQHYVLSQWYHCNHQRMDKRELPEKHCRCYLYYSLLYIRKRCISSG